MGKINKYVIIASLIAAAAVIVMLLINPKPVQGPKVDTKLETEQKKSERQYVKVDYDTLRSLCRNYPGLGNCSISKELKCNIPSSDERIIENLFGAVEYETWKHKVANGNVIILDAEITSDNDTVVMCPVVMLYHLVKAYERYTPAQAVQ